MSKHSGGSGVVSTLVKGKVLLAILAGLGGVLALLLMAFGLKSLVFSENKTTRLGFEDIGELATQSVYCTEVNVTEAAREFYGVQIPFTQSKYIYSYDITIKAGYDFSAIQWSVDEESKTIQVKLPQVRILSNIIDTDSFQVYHESESIFRPITLEENNQAMADLQKTAEEDAIANGLFENARSNAEVILTGFFSSVYDLNEYTIRFSDL